jgi:hypothetical protein
MNHFRVKQNWIAAEDWWSWRSRGASRNADNVLETLRHTVGEGSFDTVLRIGGQSRLPSSDKPH